MKFKTPIILLIFFSFLNIIKTQTKAPEFDVDYPGIECGKKNPKKDKDCTKYGTDSDMLCCYVEKGDDAPFCTLLYNGRAEELGINGKAEFDSGEYWSCGNKSIYLSINFIIILISIFFY